MIKCCFNTFSFLLIILSPTSFAYPIDTRTLFEKLVAVRPMISPASSVVTPIAYGLDFGTFVFGVAGQVGTQYTSRPFGEYAVGFGLGDANHSISLTTIASFGGMDEVIRDGNLNFQLSRNLNSNTAIAIGIENVVPWGADCRNFSSLYIVVSTLFTKLIHEEYSISFIATMGVGNSRFVHDYETHTDERKIIRPLASLGLQLLPQAALIIDYVGLTYNAGISLVPFPEIPLAFSMTALDLTHRGGNRIPIAGSIGYAYQF